MVGTHAGARAKGDAQRSGKSLLGGPRFWMFRAATPAFTVVQDESVEKRRQLFQSLRG